MSEIIWNHEATDIRKDFRSMHFLRIWVKVGGYKPWYRPYRDTFVRPETAIMESMRLEFEKRSGRASLGTGQGRHL